MIRKLCRVTLLAAALAAALLALTVAAASKVTRHSFRIMP